MTSNELLSIVARQWAETSAEERQVSKLEPIAGFKCMVLSK
jgi:hypothetical protein